MADYGVYFNITNGLGAPLVFHRFESAEGDCCRYGGPASIPSDGRPHQVRLDDTCFARGAAGTVAFVAEVGGQLRQYAWQGDDPVWSRHNAASGPGIVSFNDTGHPLVVTVAVDPSTPGWEPAERLIEHVFVLMLENRSMDHMLGFSGIRGTDAETGQPTQIDGLTGTESNAFEGVSYPVGHPAPWTMPVDPPHEFPEVVTQLAGKDATYPPGGPYPTPIDDSGFVYAYAKAGGKDDPGLIMKAFAPGQLPVLTSLAEEFAVLDRWHSSMPGPTWCNRFFMMAASAGGLDRSPSTGQILEWETVRGFSFEHGTIFDALHRAGRSWRVYRGDRGPLSGSIPIAAALKGVSILHTADFSNFAADLQGDYPYAFTLIEPNYGDVVNESYKGGTSQHPVDDVRGGELLIKQTYEALRNSPLWHSSLLIVTWDEHGGFYDHTIPDATVPPGDRITTPGEVNIFGFTFDRLGVRVPAVVVSPYVPRNLIDHRPYEHSSIPKTVESLFGLPTLTARDEAVSDVLGLASLPTPRDTPTHLPDPGEPAPPPELADADRAAHDAQPVGDGNVAGFLGVALQVDLDLRPSDEHHDVRTRVAAIETNAQARQYLEEVGERIAALKPR